MKIAFFEVFPHEEEGIKKFFKGEDFEVFREKLTKETDERINKSIKKMTKTMRRLIREGKKKTNSEAMKKRYESGDLIPHNKGKKSPWTTKRNKENN